MYIVWCCCKESCIDWRIHWIQGTLCHLYCTVYHYFSKCSSNGINSDHTYILDSYIASTVFQHGLSQKVQHVRRHVQCVTAWNLTSLNRLQSTQDKEIMDPTHVMKWTQWKTWKKEIRKQEKIEQSEQKWCTDRKKQVREKIKPACGVQGIKPSACLHNTPQTKKRKKKLEDHR